MSQPDRAIPRSTSTRSPERSALLIERLARVTHDAAGDAHVPADLLGEYLRILADAAIDGRQPAESDLAGVRQLGRRAAEQGVAADRAVDLYLSAASLLWQDVAVQAPEVRTAADVSDAAGAVLRVVNAAVAAFIEGHQEARRQLVRQEEAARNRFVDDLLRGDADVARLVQRAEPFGIDLARHHQVALASSSATRVLERAALVMERFTVDRIGDRDVLVAVKDDLLVMVVPGRADRAPSDPADALDGLLQEELRRRFPTETWQLSVGRPFPGAYGVARSYEEAREALLLARRLHLHGSIVPVRDLLMYRVLGRDQAALSDLVQTLLLPLRAARGGAGPLLLTLDRYLAAGGVATETARTLQVSVRTVTYRLARIAQLTGYDPVDVNGRLALHMAVVGARLLDWPATPLPQPTQS